MSNDNSGGIWQGPYWGKSLHLSGCRQIIAIPLQAIIRETPSIICSLLRQLDLLHRQQQYLLYIDKNCIYQTKDSKQPYVIRQPTLQAAGHPITFPNNMILPWQKPYIAPEYRKVSFRRTAFLPTETADLYSLFSVLYTLIMGTPAPLCFEIKNLKSAYYERLCKELPKEVSEACFRLLCQCTMFFEEYRPLYASDLLTTDVCNILIEYIPDPDQ